MRISDWSSDVCSSDLLEVAALGGRPGVYTADWAERQWFEGEPGRDWYMAMGKVEGLLAGQGPGVDRSACFVCTLALAWPDAHAGGFAGWAAGSLTWPPRGRLGFGYVHGFGPAGTPVGRRAGAEGGGTWKSRW